MNSVRVLFDALMLPLLAPLAAKDSTHFTLFEKPRFAFFEEIRRFLRE